jgi:hypothetical protein
MRDFVFVTFTFKNGSIKKKFDKEEPSQLFSYLCELEETKERIY